MIEARSRDGRPRDLGRLLGARSPHRGDGDGDRGDPTRPCSGPRSKLLVRCGARARGAGRAAEPRARPGPTPQRGVCPRTRRRGPRVPCPRSRGRRRCRKHSGGPIAAFHATTTASGVSLVNLPQRLERGLRAGRRRGVAGDAQLGLSLQSVGYGDDLRPVAQAVPEGSANGVAYQRGSLVEWYKNGPLGVEQGFTLASPPRASPWTGHLTLQLQLVREPVGDAGPDGDGITLRRPGSTLRYAGLFAVDADGRDLDAQAGAGRAAAARCASTTRTRRTRSRSTRPSTPSRTGCTASDAAAGDEFGYAVAVSGETIVVGAPSDDVSGLSDRGLGLRLLQVGGDLEPAGEARRVGRRR